ncbi:DNA primase [Gordonia phage Pleakley]|uniref:DNA primase/polymerase/helicase n=1 Tax=Gordonia phage Pleakley TaxID=2283246 RepID=A0A345M6H8_9CAUD|nr:DNA primase [Gordonia phage Pleakley]AXH49786.1 DNA primase/polymerase/helicase [Gordonia phage Fury]AXH66099.1 DNA primase/polymerase/helicase [Gordonia phage Pleakley]
MTTYGDHAGLYLRQGWASPLPLPEGMKYPPPDDTTGNKPYVDPNDIENWAEEIPESNIGLRMPTVTIDGEKYEVIGLDVDQYDNKTGGETLTDLIAEYGSLPRTWRSTSRDPENPSGIRFYLVPAGLKWKGKPGPDIEIIQRTHRYAVVWPSTVSDRTYRWYDLDEHPTDAPPRVKDLPKLPQAWIEGLCKGDAGQVRVIEEIDDIEEAFEWLEREIPGYDSDPSGAMDRTTDPAKLEDEMSSGAHDMMVNRVHEIVQLAAEGHHGLKIGLSRVRKAFFEDVLGAKDSEARRDLTTSKLEWRRALCGEVSKLRADIANDLIRISTVGGYTAADGDIDLSVFREKTLAQWIERRNTIVDATEYEDSDSGRAHMFLDALGDAIRPIRSGADEWAWWDDEIGRLVKLSKAETYGLLWSRTVQASLRAAAEGMWRLGSAQEEQGMSEADDTLKQAKAYEKRATEAGNRTKIEHSMSLAHAFSTHPVDPADFDIEPLTWGVGNGVLDLRAVKARGAVDSYDELCRKGKPEDLILQHTPVAYEPKFTHALWDNYLATFLPDPDYRRYVRKVLGYAFMGGNPQRRIVFLQGGTSTGKTTIIEACQAALGDYAASIDMNGLFRQKRDAGPMPEIIAAFPRRVVFASEVGQRNKLHSDVIKRLTGGDSVTARALYSNVMVQRTPMFTPIIATNSMPTIDDGDAALWRRLLVLPFDSTVPLNGPDVTPIKNVPEALRAVLCWLVDGLIDYLMEGLDNNVPKEVLARRRTFISGTSAFQTFLAEKIRVESKGKITATKLFEIYKQWCKLEDVRDPMSKREFMARMNENGHPSQRMTVRRGGKVSSEHGYRGITLA